MKTLIENKLHDAAVLFSLVTTVSLMAGTLGYFTGYEKGLLAQQPAVEASFFSMENAGDIFESASSSVGSAWNTTSSTASNVWKATTNKVSNLEIFN